MELKRKRQKAELRAVMRKLDDLEKSSESDITAGARESPHDRRRIIRDENPESQKYFDKLAEERTLREIEDENLAAYREFEAEKLARQRLRYEKANAPLRLFVLPSPLIRSGRYAKVTGRGIVKGSTAFGHLMKELNKMRKYRLVSRTVRRPAKKPKQNVIVISANSNE